MLKILNHPVNVETNYSADTGVVEARVPFCTHKRHAMEFKFFVDVSDPDLLETVKSTFAQSPSCTSSSISDSLKNRVYMLHERFLTKETDSGFVNNVLYAQ